MFMKKLVSKDVQVPEGAVGSRDFRVVWHLNLGAARRSLENVFLFSIMLSLLNVLMLLKAFLFTCWASYNL